MDGEKDNLSKAWNTPSATIAAALELGCRTVYSEDLNDGQDYGGVTEVNPFK